MPAYSPGSPSQTVALLSHFIYGTGGQRAKQGTVRNLVCGAIVKPQEASYGDQEGYTG
jgi:hypothetical protein